LEQAAGWDDGASHFEREVFFKGRGSVLELDLGGILFKPIALFIGLENTEIDEEIEACAEVIDEGPGLGILGGDEGVL
jgi:hypothetical protein